MRVLPAAAPALAMLLMAAAPAPSLPAGQATPVAAPYNTSADAHKQVAGAIEAARATHRRVLLDFGGNWCPDCRMLAGVLAEPAVKSWTEEHFATVMIDVGRMKKNMDIAAKYGVKITAVPTVLVVTPDGVVVNADKPFALSDDRSWSQQQIVDQLAKWE